MAGSAAAQQINLLSVEDNPLDSRALARAAQRVETPFHLTQVVDGEQAIEHLTSDAVPDMVLLDLNLPALSGHDVLTFMQNHDSLRRLPTVILTTSEDQGDIERAYDLGANAYLAKPTSLAGWDDLLARVEAFWLSIVLFPPSARPDQ